MYYLTSEKSVAGDNEAIYVIPQINLWLLFFKRGINTMYFLKKKNYESIFKFPLTLLFYFNTFVLNVIKLILLFSFLYGLHENISSIKFALPCLLYDLSLLLIMKWKTCSVVFTIVWLKNSVDCQRYSYFTHSPPIHPANFGVVP